MGSLAGFCLFAFIARHNRSSKHFSSLPVESLLNQDGTLKLNTGFVGTLDLYGWDAKLDSKRGPVLTRQQLNLQKVTPQLANYLDPKASNPSYSRSLLANNSWSALAYKGLNGVVEAIAVTENNMYIGGAFDETPHGEVKNLNNIAKYSNDTWLGLSNQGLGGPVYALANLGNDLYVGGEFNSSGDGAVTNLGNIARYTNGVWSALPNGGLYCCNSGHSLSRPTIRALTVMGNDLYVGGIFTETMDGTVRDLNGIAKYSNGVWSALSNQGLKGSVYALVTIGNVLYVGGDFAETADGEVTNLGNIARYTNGVWSALSHQGLDSHVNAFATQGNDLYVGGDCSGPLELDSI